MKVAVYIMPRAEILDPQGRAVEHALHSLGFEKAREVRVGKCITLDLETDSPQEAARMANEMCEQLLANTTIEDYRVEVEQR